MYKKVSTCEVVVLLIKPIVFFFLTFSLSSASLDLNVPITSIRLANFEMV